MKSASIFTSLTRGCKFGKGVASVRSKSAAPAPQLDLLSLVAPLPPSSSSAGKRKDRPVVDEDEDEDEDEVEGEDEGEEEASSGSEEDDSGSAAAGSRSFKTEESVNEFRNMMQIKAKGSRVPNPATTFADMVISEDIKTTLLRNIEESSWKEPTAIQMQAIPCMLAGRDVLAAAPTGSGKTAAYLIPVLSILSARGTNKKSGIRAVILAPTRELAEQICREAKRLSAGRRIKVGLLKKSNAAQALAQRDGSALGSYDVLIATPMRLLYLTREQAVNLSAVQIVVLDEADKLF